MAVKKTTEQFIDEAQRRHNNTYDYHLVNYVNSRTKIIIICKTHGPFEQQPRAHLCGQGCPRCNQNENWTPTSDTQRFIKRSRQVHGDIYDYSVTNYIGCMKKLKIKCPKHGIFEQLANGHLNGRGCQKCAKNQKKTTEEFIQEAIMVHGHKYNYSNVEYANALVKISIICPEHGEFKQIPNTHLMGQGCLKCGIQSMRDKLSNNPNEFIARLNKIHNNKYDYSKVIYNNRASVITIICPIHGEFRQKASEHLRGYGCQQCAGNNVKTTEQFISEAKIRWGNRYQYNHTIYINTKSKIIVTCPKHGDFWITAGYHLTNGGCPTCTLSSNQYDLLQFVKTLVQDVRSNDRSIISPYELDIVIPSHNFAIEFNGNFYHSYNRVETTEERRRHQLKTNLTEHVGIQLLQISTHDWKKRELIESMIKHRLGMSKKIHARKCTIITPSTHQIKEFFEKNHISGYRAAKISYGLFYEDKLISIINFNEIKSGEWEIIRYASFMGISVVGGLSKILTKFIREYSPKVIHTFVDRRYGNGGGYLKTGFKLVGITRPGYVYLDSNCNPAGSRIKFQKHKLRDILPTFDQNLTEAENMFQNGYRRMWDAGHLKMKLIRIPFT